MMQGVACADPALADRITSIAFQNGLIIETSGGKRRSRQAADAADDRTGNLAEAGLDILEHAVAEAVSELSNSEGQCQVEQAGDRMIVRKLQDILGTPRDVRRKTGAAAVCCWQKTAWVSPCTTPSFMPARKRTSGTRTIWKACIACRERVRWS
jgi:hypothetical protein